MDAVRLTVVETELEASMLRGLLESAGVRATTSPSDLNPLIPSGAGVRGWDVMVAPEDVDRALEVLEHVDETEEALAYEPDEVYVDEPLEPTVDVEPEQWRIPRRLVALVAVALAFAAVLWLESRLF